MTRGGTTSVVGRVLVAVIGAAMVVVGNQKANKLSGGVGVAGFVLILMALGALKSD